MLIVVGCGEAKLAHAAPARELYTGSLFVDHLRLATRLARGVWRSDGEVIWASPLCQPAKAQTDLFEGVA